MQSKSIFEKDRRELLAIPETIASYFYEAVNKVSPKVSQFLLDTVQSPTVIAARYGKFCTNTPTAMCEKGEGGVGERTAISVERSKGKLISNQSLMYQGSEVLEGGAEVIWSAGESSSQGGTLHTVFTGMAGTALYPCVVREEAAGWREISSSGSVPQWCEGHRPGSSCAYVLLSVGE